MNELVQNRPPGPSVRAVASRSADRDRCAGDRAARRFLEFSPPHSGIRTRAWPYYRACAISSPWVEQHQIGELADIEPSTWHRVLEAPCGTRPQSPDRSMHLAAIQLSTGCGRPGLGNRRIGRPSTAWRRVYSGASEDGLDVGELAI